MINQMYSKVAKRGSDNKTLAHALRSLADRIEMDSEVKIQKPTAHIRILREWDERYLQDWVTVQMFANEDGEYGKKIEGI